ncbi:unnamed protein product [Jaminaea pallidilutea]
MTRDAAGMTLRSVTKRKRGGSRQKCQGDRRPGANGRVSGRSSRTADTDGGEDDNDSGSEGTGTGDDDTDSNEEEGSTAPAKSTQLMTTQLAKSATAAVAASACKRQRTSSGAQSLGLWHEYDPALRFEARRLHDDKESAVEVAERMCAAGHGKAKVDNRGRKPFNGRQRLVCTTAYGRCPWLCEVQPIHDDDGYGRKVTSWRCVLVKGVHDHEPQRVSRGIQTEPESPVLVERGIQAAEALSVPGQESGTSAVQLPQLQHAARLHTPGETTITEPNKESARGSLDTSSKGQENPQLATVSPDNSESELSDCSGSDSDSVDSGGKTNDDDYASCSSQQTEVPANFGHMKSEDIPAGAGKKDRARYMLWIQVQALVSAQNPRNPTQAAVRIFNREWEDVKADLTTSRDAQPHENAPTAVAEATDVPNQTIPEKNAVTTGPSVNLELSTEKRHIGTQHHSKLNGRDSCAQQRPLSTRAPASVQQNRISPVRPSPPLSSATGQLRQPSGPRNDNAVLLPPSRGRISTGQTPSPEPSDAQRVSVERKKRPVSVRQSLRLPLIPPAATPPPPLDSNGKAEPTPSSAFDAWANSNCLAFTAPKRSAHNVQILSKSPLQAPQATERHAQTTPSAQSNLSAHAATPSTASSSVSTKEAPNATSDTPVRSKFSAPETVKPPAVETGAANETAPHISATRVAPGVLRKAGSQAPASITSTTAQATVVPSRPSPLTPGSRRSGSPRPRTTETVAAPLSPLTGAAPSGSTHLGSEKETLAEEISRGAKTSESPSEMTNPISEPVQSCKDSINGSGSQASLSVRQQSPLADQSLKSPSKSTAAIVASPSKHESGASKFPKEGAALQKWLTSPTKSRDYHSSASGAASPPGVLQDTAKGFNLSRSQSAIHQPMHWTQRSALLQIRSSPGPSTPSHSLDVICRKQETADISKELAVVIKPAPGQRRTMSSPTPGARPRPRPTPYCRAIAKRTGRDTSTSASLSQPTPASNATPSQHMLQSEIQPAMPAGPLKSPSHSMELSVKPSQSRSAVTVSRSASGNGSFDAPFVLSDEDD